MSEERENLYSNLYPTSSTTITIAQPSAVPQQPQYAAPVTFYQNEQQQQQQQQPLRYQNSSQQTIIYSEQVAGNKKKSSLGIYFLN